jgi:soluble lytic murein transglycosylase-like protein
MAVILAATAVAGCGENYTLDQRHVPVELVPLFQAAAKTYGELSAAQLAAQARVESKFDEDAVSRAGARGLMQFLPTTWAEFGLDGNDDHVADPLEPADAIMSAARYDAHLAELVGNLPGDRVSLILAAYNAGPAAVQSAGGIPDITETRAYVERVRIWAQTYAGQL